MCVFCWKRFIRHIPSHLVGVIDSIRYNCNVKDPRLLNTYFECRCGSFTISYYAALLPRRGPHIASHSVCPSVCLSVPLSLYVAPPSELQWHTCSFPHALRAAYRTAISAAQILVVIVIALLLKNIVILSIIHIHRVSNKLVRLRPPYGMRPWNVNKTKDTTRPQGWRWPIIENGSFFYFGCALVRRF